MDEDHTNNSGGSGNPNNIGDSEDLVGGSFAVLESDPGVFTMLVRKLGILGLEVTELYGIEPWAVDHLNPFGLIFCYLCVDETEQDTENTTNDFDTPDPDAEGVWFAHQLSDDACSSQAILNVVLNCRDVQLGPDLRRFLDDTVSMSSVMKGLAITNCRFIRDAQNSLARPADIRASEYAVANTALENEKKRAAAKSTNSPTKRRKQSSIGVKRKKPIKTDDKQESYHFIGYVPCNGRVWELDGLRISGPVEVGELPHAEAADPVASRRGWMDVVRPALKMRMQRYLSSGGSQTGHIRYNLLAIIQDRYQNASDSLEFLKRERTALERRLTEAFPDGWRDKVDPSLLSETLASFTTTLQPETAGPTFAQDFGIQKMEKDMQILDMPVRKLVPAWETCVRTAMTAKVAVEDEITISTNINNEHLRRTFDYEPFIREFVACMHNEGLLESVLSGKPDPGPSEVSSSKAKTSPTRRKKAKR